MKCPGLRGALGDLRRGSVHCVHGNWRVPAMPKSRGRLQERDGRSFRVENQQPVSRLGRNGAVPSASASATSAVRSEFSLRGIGTASLSGSEAITPAARIVLGEVYDRRTTSQR